MCDNFSYFLVLDDVCESYISCGKRSHSLSDVIDVIVSHVIIVFQVGEFLRSRRLDHLLGAFICLMILLLTMLIIKSWWKLSWFMGIFYYTDNFFQERTLLKNLTRTGKKNWKRSWKELKQRKTANLLQNYFRTKVLRKEMLHL